MDDRLDAARALFPGARLESVATLAGSDRSDVRRVLVHRDGAEPETVIVKSFLDGGEGWARESAALSVLPAETPVPRLLQASADPPVLVLADLGDGPNVADAVLGADPVAAADAIAGWAEALAGLHRWSRGLRETFRDALAARSGELSFAAEPVAAELGDTLRVVDEHCGALGVATSTAAFDEIRALAHRLGSDGAAALTPADACPDNNIRTADGYALLDFEGAQWRHVAWDLAYLRVPWPTCWCAWRLPDAVADTALARYRAAAGPVLEDVPDADLDAAAVGWAFASVHRSLRRALDDDPPMDPHLPVPDRRAMILHRLDSAQRNQELGHAAELAERLRGALVERWGEYELAYAPAWR